MGWHTTCSQGRTPRSLSRSRAMTCPLGHGRGQAGPATAEPVLPADRKHPRAFSSCPFRGPGCWARVTAAAPRIREVRPAQVRHRRPRPENVPCPWPLRLSGLGPEPREGALPGLRRPSRAVPGGFLPGTRGLGRRAALQTPGRERGPQPRGLFRDFLSVPLPRLSTWPGASTVQGNPRERGIL